MCQNPKDPTMRFQCLMNESPSGGSISEKFEDTSFE